MKFTNPYSSVDSLERTEYPIVPTVGRGEHWRDRFFRSQLNLPGALAHYAVSIPPGATQNMIPFGGVELNSPIGAVNNGIKLDGVALPYEQSDSFQTDIDSVTIWFDGNATTVDRPTDVFVGISPNAPIFTGSGTTDMRVFFALRTTGGQNWYAEIVNGTTQFWDTNIAQNRVDTRYFITMHHSGTVDFVVRDQAGTTTLYERLGEAFSLGSKNMSMALQVSGQALNQWAFQMRQWGFYYS